MGELWSRVGGRPVLDGLDQVMTAEILLRVGVLTGWIGSVHQTEGAQEIAKDLITESITLFEELNEIRKVAEARTEIALCYWRQGELNEARIILRGVLRSLTDKDRELKAVALLRSVIVEKEAKRFCDALKTLTEAESLFTESGNHALRGQFHGQLANVLENLGRAEHSDEYTDRALIEYAAASFHFEQAGHKCYHACVENNLGFLFFTIGRFKEAHEHLERSSRLLSNLKDKVHAAQVDETRAKTLLAESRNTEAEKIGRRAVEVLEKGDERSLLAEALTTQGVALARLKRFTKARLTFQRARVIAEQAGDMVGVGKTMLSMIEELAADIDSAELAEMYKRAAELLEKSQQPGMPERLIKSGRLVVRLLAARLKEASVNVVDESTAFDWKGFSLKKEMRRHERRIIGRALKEAGGTVSRAAHLLGFKHYQSLISLINSRHQSLLQVRSPVVPRRRSIFRSEQPAPKRAATKRARRVHILYAEDNRAVAEAVKKVLEAAGWRVEVCSDGLAALKKITSQTHYDLLLVDNELPGIGGLELVRQARKLLHRRRMPILMLSASDCETAAWGAGVDAFLKKPGDLRALASIVGRLLSAEGNLH